MKPSLTFPIVTALLLSSLTLAQDTTTTTTTEPSETSTTTGILRPSAGETVTYGSFYTISWSPPPPSPAGPLALEIKGDTADIHWILPNWTSCDGWMLNTQCKKFDVDIPAGSTSFVWNMTDPEIYSIYVGDGEPYRLGLYVDNLGRGAFPDTHAEWYWDVAFTVAEPVTTTTTTSTTTSTATATTTDSEIEGATETDTATDGAGSLRGSAGGNVLIVSVLLMLGLLV
ncbi:hypothetical protein BJY01DRAFT_245807 [Aspergillus pseudoustus]|uniref:Ser-Thr-rich glycosyl-phosphatidyl-inositol-anchored membrane family-domain-containing protein n=1 Tax=Aspergillus pseudoustus TaxID=1810923 RepID=A0ABR4KCV9_9EURO